MTETVKTLVHMICFSDDLGRMLYADSELQKMGYTKEGIIALRKEYRASLGYTPVEKF